VLKRTKKFLPDTHPELLKEWDYDRNCGLHPDDVSYGSHKKVWWKCNKGHSWPAIVKDRTSGKSVNCPYCSGRVPTSGNNLFELFPKLGKDWYYDKNILKPWEVLPGSGKKVWWVCKVCGYSWKATISNRTKNKRPSGCPECRKNNLRVKFNYSFQYVKEEFAKSGFKLLAEEYINSKENMSYVCVVCGYKGSKCLNNVQQGRACPICSLGSISKVSQDWLDSLSVEIREYYIKDLGLRVDGFDPETNTVYEFLGDYWHGNPEIFPAEKLNPTSRKLYGELFKETMERISILKECGYKVVAIWENNYLKGGI